MIQVFNIKSYRKKAGKDGKEVLINSVCPGFVKTDMSSYSSKSRKYPAEGCKTSLWLALLPEGLEQGSAIDPRIPGITGIPEISGIGTGTWDSFSKSEIWDTGEFWDFSGFPGFD